MTMVLPFLLGCGGAALQNLARLPAAAGLLVTTFPADGARNMGGSIPVTVVLGADGEGRTPTAGWEQGDDLGRLACDLEDNDLVAHCGELPSVQPAEDWVSAWARVEPEQLDATVQPGTPQAAWAWEIGAGSVDIEIGGQASTGDLLEGLLGDLNLVAVLEGFAGKPMTGDLVLGPVEHGLDESVRRPLAPGFTMVLEAEVTEDGRLVAGAPGPWLPVGSGEEAHHLLLLDATLQAVIADRGLAELSLDARLPAWSLLVLADEAGMTPGALAQLVTLDVDWDGDGEPDSASLHMATQAQPVALSTW